MIGVLELQDPLQSGTKTTLRHPNYEAQALTLFQESPDPCGDLIWARRNFQEPSCHGKDRQTDT
jgi:hypothetical protein